MNQMTMRVHQIKIGIKGAIGLKRLSTTGLDCRVSLMFENSLSWVYVAMVVDCFLVVDVCNGA